MLMKQLSIFIENREGRLEQVTETLSAHQVDIQTLSLADTTEFGMLRLIVSDAEKGRRVLKEEGFSTKLTEVVVIKMENKIGFLNKLLQDIGSEHMNIEYMYTMPGIEAPFIIIKVEDSAGLELKLSEKGYYK